MPKLAVIDCAKVLLSRMLKELYIGDHQALEENLTKFFPRDKRGLAKDAVELIKRRGFVLTKHKHYGVHVSINPQKVANVEEFLKG
ncbi:hypothetical protein HYS54_01540 [Candidatus Micrarchaeota archaeon]|nr:hypothetical protein [Candidatus Micrarchaeota archaeon]